MDESIKKHLFYHPESGDFIWHTPTSKRVKSGTIAGSYDAHGYKCIRFKGKSYKAHRLAFMFMGKEVPDYVDHINGIRDDNRWVNLRPSCKVTNGYNRLEPCNNTSGFKGVYYNNGKWVAEIKADKVKTYLGRFDSLEGAVAARREASKKYHKEFNRG